MAWFLFGIGIVWIMFGTLMVFATDVVKNNCYAKLKDKDPRLLSPFPILGGTLLLLCASSSSQQGFVVVLGLLLLFKGLTLLFGPRPKLSSIMAWWFNASDTTHKFSGTIIIVLGIAVLASLSPLIG